MNELVSIALRSVIVYAYLLVVVRLLGKREIGAFSAFDLVVALILGELADEVIMGDATLAEGAVAASTAALLHFLNSLITYKSKVAEKVLAGSPVVLVQDGALRRAGLARERINEEELWSELRRFGLEQKDLADVKLATLETDGHLTVIRRYEAEPVLRRDVAALAKT